MQIADHDMDFLRGIVAELSGNVIAPRQVYMLEQHLNPLAESMGLPDIDAQVNELRRTHNATLKNKVAEAVTAEPVIWH